MSGDEWTQATSDAVRDTQYVDDEWDDGDTYEPAPETDNCLGPDDPGVGPWTDEFAD